MGSSPTVGGLFVYFDGARNERHDPVSTTARGARLHAREVQGGRLKICWAKVRLGSNPSAGKTFLARVAFWRAVVLNNQSNNVDKHAAPRGLVSSAACRSTPGYWRNWKRASLARTRYWDRNPDTPVAHFFIFALGKTRPCPAYGSSRSRRHHRG